MADDRGTISIWDRAGQSEGIKEWSENGLHLVGRGIRGSLLLTHPATRHLLQNCILSPALWQWLHAVDMFSGLIFIFWRRGGRTSSCNWTVSWPVMSNTKTLTTLPSLPLYAAFLRPCSRTKLPILCLNSAILLFPVVWWWSWDSPSWKTVSESVKVIAIYCYSFVNCNYCTYTKPDSSGWVQTGIIWVFFVVGVTKHEINSFLKPARARRKISVPNSMWHQSF